MDRRNLLLGLGASVLGGTMPRNSSAAGAKVRLSKSGPGTAGTIQDGMISLFPDLSSGLEIKWVDGDPGQLQVFILSGAIDSGPFGALGLAEVAQKGTDLVMFGPRL